MKKAKKLVTVKVSIRIPPEIYERAKRVGITTANMRHYLLSDGGALDFLLKKIQQAEWNSQPEYGR